MLRQCTVCQRLLQKDPPVPRSTCVLRSNSLLFQCCFSFSPFAHSLLDGLFTLCCSFQLKEKENLSFHLGGLPYLLCMRCTSAYHGNFFKVLTKRNNTLNLSLLVYRFIFKQLKVKRRAQSELVRTEMGTYHQTQPKGGMIAWADLHKHSFITFLLWEKFKQKFNFWYFTQ